MRAIFRLRPPLPKYKNTFDIKPVLDYFTYLGDNEDLTLKQLTLKTHFLISFTSISRVSTCSRLGLAVDVFEDHIAGVYKVLPPPILFLATPLITYLNFDYSMGKDISCTGKM